jgi:hypothetical protein
MELVSYIKQPLPFDALIAEHTRVGGRSCGYRLPERLCDLAVEGISHVHVVPRDAKMLTLGLRSSRGADVTAGTVLREVQSNPDDIFTKLSEE